MLFYFLLISICGCDTEPVSESANNKSKTEAIKTAESKTAENKKQPVKNKENQEIRFEVLNKVFEVDNGDIGIVSYDLDDYINKAVRLTGTFVTTKDTSKDVHSFIMDCDTGRYKESVLIEYKGPKKELHYDDYLAIEGRILGIHTIGEEWQDNYKEYVVVQADKIQLGYVYCRELAHSVLHVNQTIKQSDISFNLKKVEFADSETRAFISVINNSDQLYRLESKAVDPNGKEAYDGYPFENYSSIYSPINTDFGEVGPGKKIEWIIEFPSWDVEQKQIRLYFGLSGIPFDFKLKWE